MKNIKNLVAFPFFTKSVTTLRLNFLYDDACGLLDNLIIIIILLLLLLLL